MSSPLALVSSGQSFRALRFDYQATRETLVTRMAPQAGPRFTWTLLEELRRALDQINQGQGWFAAGHYQPVQYIVLGSLHPRFYSLGGDLSVFYDCISRGDRGSLLKYSRTCMEMIYAWSTSWIGSRTTLALVQGRALGGGFEAALGAEFLVAEEHAEFGFPEILFGLFPASGAFSLLKRRAGILTAQRLMTDGKVYKARELQALGLVDLVCRSGDGMRVVQEFIDEHAKHQKARLAVQRARARHDPISYEEMVQVVDEWVEAAMGLSKRDLRMIDWLIRAQASDAW